MRDYILTFCSEFEYPHDAVKHLIAAYDQVTQHPPSRDVFFNLLDNYECSDEIFPLLDPAAESSNVHPYTLHLVYHICLSRHLRKLYQQKQLPDSMFNDSMSDLKCKLLECYKRYGIWGSSVAKWFRLFFELTRFGLGRLQFEPIKFPVHYTKTGEYTKAGHTLREGDMVLNVHIPSSGPLHYDACLDSYRRAAEFFKEYFVNRPTAFVCDSWLMFREHREFLPKTSNILTFINDYDIIKDSDKDYEIKISWTIFNQAYTGSAADLPRDTSLRRAYADWIAKGNPTGGGFGVFFFDGSVIK